MTEGNQSLNQYVIGIGVDGSALKAFQDELVAFAQQISSTINKNVNINIKPTQSTGGKLSQIDGAINSIDDTASKTSSSVNKSVADINQNLSNIGSANTSKLDRYIDSVSKKINNLQAKISTLHKDFGDGKISSNQLDSALKRSEKSFNTIIDKAKQAGVDLKNLPSSIPTTFDKIKPQTLTTPINDLKNVKGAAHDADVALGQYGNRSLQYSENITRAARLSKNEITDMFKRVVLWSSGIAVLFGSMSRIKQSFQDIKDLEVAMAELKKVMGDYTPYDKVQENIFRSGKLRSVAVDAVADVAQIWAQQGKTYQQVAMLTDATLLGINSANFEAGQAVEFLTSVTKSYNIEAERTISVMDGVMSVQGQFAVTAQNLADAFTQVGATASVMGDDISSVMGYITAVTEVTRETGRVVGTSFKTSYARLNTKETQGFLGKYGIATVDAKTGERANARQIFQQIAEKDLSRKDIVDISLKIGGVRKFKDILILIERWSEAEKARATYLEAYNSAAAASDIATSTLSKKLDRLGVASTELSDKVLGASLLPKLKLATDGIYHIVDALSQLANTSVGGAIVGTAPSVLGAGAIAGLYGVLKKNVVGDIIRQGDVKASFTESGLPFSKLGQQTIIESSIGVSRMDDAQFKTFLSNYDELLEKEELTNEAIAERKKLAGSNAQLAEKILKTEQSILALRAAGVKFAQQENLARKGVLSNITGNASAFGVGFSGGLRDSWGLGKKGGAAESRLAWLGIGNKLAGFASGLVKMGVAAGAVELVFFGFAKSISFAIEKIKGLTPTYLPGGIDTESEASKSFFSVFSKKKSVIEEAKSGGVTIESVADRYTNAEKIELLRKDFDPIGKKLADGTIDTVQKLYKELSQSFNLENVNDALRLQYDAFKFYNYELGKQKEVLRNNLMSVRESVKKGYEGKAIRVIGNESIGTSGDARFAGNYKVGDPVGYGRTSDNNFVISEFGRALRETQSIAKFLDDSVGKAYKDMDEYISVLQAKTGKPNEISNALVKAYVAQLEKTELSKYKPSPQAETSGTVYAYDSAALQDLAYAQAVENAVNSFFQTDRYMEQLNKVIPGLKTHLKEGIDGLTTTLAGVGKALTELEDHLFNAANKFASSINSITTNVGVNGALGIAFDANKEKLGAVRSFVSEIVSIPNQLIEKRGELERQYELLNKISADSVQEVELVLKTLTADATKRLSSGNGGAVTNTAQRINEVLNEQLPADLDETVNTKITGVASSITKLSAELQLLYEDFAFVSGGSIDALTGRFEKLGLDIDVDKLREFYTKSGDDVKVNIDGLIGYINDIYFKQLNEYLKGVYDNIIKQSEETILKNKFQFRSGILSSYTSGVNADDIKKKFDIEANSIREVYNYSLSILDEKIREFSKNPDNAENIEVLKEQRAKLIADNKISVESMKAAEAQELYADSLELSKKAIDSFKSSFSSWLSDIDNFNFNRASGFKEGILNLGQNIANIPLNSISEKFTETIVKSLDGIGFGSLLATDKYKVETPEEILNNSILYLDGVLLREIESTINLTSAIKDMATHGVPLIQTPNATGIEKPEAKTDTPQVKTEVIVEERSVASAKKTQVEKADKEQKSPVEPPHLSPVAKDDKKNKTQEVIVRQEIEIPEVIPFDNPFTANMKPYNLYKTPDYVSKSAALNSVYKKEPDITVYPSAPSDKKIIEQKPQDFKTGRDMHLLESIEDNMASLSKKQDIYKAKAVEEIASDINPIVTAEKPMDTYLRRNIEVKDYPSVIGLQQYPNFQSTQLNNGLIYKNKITTTPLDSNINRYDLFRRNTLPGKIETPTTFPDFTDTQANAIMGIGQIASGLTASAVSRAANTTGEYAGIGSGLGAIIGSYGGPLGTAAGSILGSAIGALFGEKPKKDSENIKRIADNTASLKALDSRIFNAPTDYKLPSQTVLGKSSVQYTGNITINVSGSGSPNDTANQIQMMFSNGVSNYNNINSSI